MSRHLTDQILALLAGNDLSRFAAWRVRRHVANCERCRTSLDEIESARKALRDAANELPPGVNWDHLAREMHANIRVGLEAAEVVAPLPARPERLGWRAAVAFASLVAVVMTGWLMSVPKLVPRPFASVSTGSAIVELSPAGVELRHGKQGFALLHPRANHVSYSIGSGGGQARFVDVETGQVTITHVSLD